MNGHSYRLKILEELNKINAISYTLISLHVNSKAVFYSGYRNFLEFFLLVSGYLI